MIVSWTYGAFAQLELYLDSAVQTWVAAPAGAATQKLYRGDSQVVTIRRGDLAVTGLYRGDILVWEP